MTLPWAETTMRIWLAGVVALISMALGLATVFQFVGTKPENVLDLVASGKVLLATLAFVTYSAALLMVPRFFRDKAGDQEVLTTTRATMLPGFPGLNLATL
jgi:hypothetical protein